MLSCSLRKCSPAVQSLRFVFDDTTGAQMRKLTVPAARQVAPTALKLVGLNPGELQGVQAEGTQPLPGIAFAPFCKHAMGKSGLGGLVGSVVGFPAAGQAPFQAPFAAPADAPGAASAPRAALSPRRAP